MADASQLQLNPYALFDPSQFLNPYSNYQSSPLPGASYVGVPYNAMGQPIQPPPGMTINQTAAQPQAPAAAAASNPLANVQQPAPGMNALGSTQRGGMGTQAWGQLTPAQRAAAYGAGGLGSYQAGLAMMPSGGQVASGANPSGVNPTAQTALALMNAGIGGNQAQQAAPSAAPATNSAGLTPQQYMAMRANPGPVGQYGATVPQAQSSAQPGTGVLQSFLANWKPASSGAGSGFQQGFSHALKGMGYT